MFPHAVKPFSKRAKCLMYHFFYYPFVIGQQMKANYFYINFLKEDRVGLANVH